MTIDEIIIEENEKLEKLNETLKNFKRMKIKQQYMDNIKRQIERTEKIIEFLEKGKKYDV